MARKKLLSEGEIRQFMKLANLRPLGASRLSEYGMHAGARDDEEMADPEAAEMEEPVDEEIPMGDDEDIPMDDMGMEDDLGDEAGGDMVSMDDFMSALEMAIEDVTGEPASVEEAPGEDEDVDMDADIDIDDAEAGMEEEPAMEMGADEEEPMMEDRIVAEVARRVAARLQKQNRKEQMVDQLAERIMKRLTK